MSVHPSSRVLFPGLALTLALSTGQAGQQAAPTTLEPIVVTAERLGQELEAERALTPGAVNIIDGETLGERSVTQLEELLRYVPGVWTASYNGNDDVFYSSRGSNLDATDYDKNGVKFLQDGLPLTAADGNNHNRAPDPLNARFVTVARGANALAYGASTLGGAIDFTSPTAHNSAPLSASLGGGSFGQWSARGTLGGVSGDFDGLLSAEVLRRDGYRAHSSEERSSLYANLGWQSSQNVATRLHATWSDFDVVFPRELSRDQVEADPLQARADAIDGDHGKEVQTWRLAFKTTVMQLAGGTLEVGASYEQQELFHPIVSGPFFSLLIDTTHKDTGTMLRYRKAVGAHALLFGANYGFSKVDGGNYENNGGEPGAFMWPTNDDASTLELFALDRWNFAPDWTLVYGTQFITADRDVGGFKGSYDAFNPRLGLILNLNETAEWYASVSRTWEAPTTFELTDDANGGGTPLAAMHGMVIETGLRGTALRGDTQWHWDVSGYWTALRDEILSIDDPDAPGTSLSANIDKTTHAGIETLLGASFAVGGGYRIEPLLSTTWNAFSFDSDPLYGDNRLPAAPRWFARGEVMLRSAAGFSAGPTFDLVGKRYSDFANTYQVGAYGLLGLRAAYRAERWEVYAEGRNLLDRHYIATVLARDVTAADAQVLFPGAPRSVYFGARYRF